MYTAIAKKESEKVQNLCKNLNFHSGGHNCHAWYWDNLAPAGNPGGILPDEKSPLSQALVKEWVAFLLKS